MNNHRLLSHVTCLSVAFLATAVCIPQVHTQQAPALRVLTADQIVAQLTRKNEERGQALEHYTSHRRYRLDYQGFPGSRTATMEVDAIFDAPLSKRFIVTGETGSKLILNRVFRRLIESEQEAANAANRSRTALTNANYSFSLAGISGTNYVLTVEPRHENKFLYKGKVWIDGIDFAVTRIEAEPANNPSFWTIKSEIQHTYEKVGNYFYLPKQNKTVTNTRLGGVATLTIEYMSYEVTASPKGAAAVRAEPVADHTMVDLQTLVAGLK